MAQGPQGDVREEEHLRARVSTYWPPGSVGRDLSRAREARGQWLERPDGLADMHERIIEALFSGDTERAIRVLREHVEEPQRRTQ